MTSYYIILHHTTSHYYRLGTQDMNYKQLSDEIDLYTNGLSVTPHLSPHHTNSSHMEQVRDTCIM